MSNRPQPRVSLGELLLSFGIVGLLATILVPLWAQSAAKDQTGTCLRQIKQLVQAEQMYAEDHDLAFAPSRLENLCDTLTGDCGDCTPQSKIGWKYLIRPYVGRSTPFRCPNNPNKNYASEDYDSRHAISYARNGRLFPSYIGGDFGVRYWDLFERPATTMILLESTWSCAELGDWVARTTDPASCQWGTAFYQHNGLVQDGKATMPNGGKGNWAYVDGHVANKKMRDLLVPYESNAWGLIPTIAEAQARGYYYADTAEFTAKDLCILYR